MKEIKRLRVIADLINVGDNIVADIGCDHGILSKMLIDEHRAIKVIATDVSRQSLQKTIDLVEKNNMQEKIETRVGDGFEPIKNEKIDFAIIAGMGGYEIIKIMECKNVEIKKYILQPSKNQNVVELRRYLNKNGYYIERDFITLDRKRFYNTIECYKSKQKQNLTFEDTEFGLTNFDLYSDDFKLYIQEYIKKKEEVINKCSEKNEFKNQLSQAKKILESFNKKK